MAVGDIDGDDETETLVAHTGDAKMTVFRPDVLKGLTSFDASADTTEVVDITVTAEFIAIADVIDDVSGLPEILALDADLGDLRVYRWNTAMNSPTLVDGANRRRDRRRRDLRQAT